MKFVVNRGFSLVELVLVIVLIGLLTAFALPRLTDLTGHAKVNTLRSIAGVMNSTIAIVRVKAISQGLRASSSNPGGSLQANYVIETEAGQSEVDWRNLCPESRAEVGDSLTMLDYLGIDPNDNTLQTWLNNRYTRVGYSLPPGSCYVEYDSFGNPECTVTVFSSGC